MIRFIKLTRHPLAGEGTKYSNIKRILVPVENIQVVVESETYDSGCYTTLRMKDGEGFTVKESIEYIGEMING